MIKLYESSMIAMDALHYWGEWSNGTTVKDVVDYISKEWSKGKVTLAFTGEAIKDAEFEDGKLKDPIPEDICKRRICDLKATRYYRYGSSMNFHVCLEDE